MPIVQNPEAARHAIEGPYQSGQKGLWLANCTCGWSSPLVEGYAETVEAWRAHCGEEPRTESGS